MALAGIIIGVVALAANAVTYSVILSGQSSSGPPSATSVFAGNPMTDDTALAQSEALPPSAYPSGFSAQGASSANASGGFFGGYTDAQVRALAACLGTPTANIDANPAESAGQRYQDQSGDNVSVNIEVYPTPEEAVADVTALASLRAPSCWLRFNPGLGAGIAKGIGSGATVGTTTAKALAIPAVGDRAAGVRMVVPIAYQGQ